MVARHGVPPLAARHPKEAIVGSTLMCGSEISWRGQKGMSKAFQRNINRMSRSSLGVLSSTPVAFLQAEGGSTPAVARLDRRQEAFTIRLAAATRGQQHQFGQILPWDGGAATFVQRRREGGVDKGGY